VSPLPNNLLESNRRCATPLSAGEDFIRALHAQDFALGGGRSANRSAAWPIVALRRL